MKTKTIYHTIRTVQTLTTLNCLYMSISAEANQKPPKGQSEATKGAIRSHQRGNQKPPKRQLEATTGAIRSHQRGNQKPPQGQSFSEATKGAIRSHQRGNQSTLIAFCHIFITEMVQIIKMKIQHRKKSLKIPKGQSEATKGAIRSHQRGNQKPPKGQSEAKGAIRSRKKKEKNGQQ